MANPQPTDAHLRMAHQISEQLMVSHFTAKQRRILDLILRLSWGCGKKQAHIPRQRDFEVIGIGEGHIKGELDILIRDKVLERDEDTYWFNKDFDKWRVSRARGYSQEKLTELVSLNLNHIVKNLPNREVENHQNLPKREVETYRNGKKELTEMGSSSDTESDTPKEIVKESIKESVVDKLIITKEDVLEIYKKEIAGLHEEESLSEYIERDIEGAIKRFTAEWVIDAIREAVKRNVRKWRYVAVILENWKRYGREPRNKGSPKNQDPDKYIKGKYGHLVQS